MAADIGDIVVFGNVVGLLVSRQGPILRLLIAVAVVAPVLGNLDDIHSPVRGGVVDVVLFGGAAGDVGFKIEAHCHFPLFGLVRPFR